MASPTLNHVRLFHPHSQLQERQLDGFVCRYRALEPCRPGCPYCSEPLTLAFFMALSPDGILWSPIRLSRDPVAYLDAEVFNDGWLNGLRRVNALLGVSWDRIEENPWGAYRDAILAARAFPAHVLWGKTVEEVEALRAPIAEDDPVAIAKLIGMADEVTACPN